MTQATIRSSRPHTWNSPRPPVDPALRLRAYGKVQSMYQPTFLERLFRRN